MCIFEKDAKQILKQYQQMPDEAQIYGYMYGNQGQIIGIKKSSLQYHDFPQPHLIYVWGFPGPDFNTYFFNDYGKTWGFSKEQINNNIKIINKFLVYQPKEIPYDWQDINNHIDDLQLGDFKKLKLEDGQEITLQIVHKTVQLNNNTEKEEPVITWITKDNINIGEKEEPIITWIKENINKEEESQIIKRKENINALPFLDKRKYKD